ncbi:MAG: GNAT family N-acetyltransferase [Alphaproteobacteria bacterium]
MARAAPSQPGFTIEPATPAERKSLASLPVVSGSGPSLKRKVERGDVLLAKLDAKIVGILIAELYGFFDENTVSLVIVDETCRRKGIGTSLVHKAEELFGRGKLFMAVNQTNVPMQTLCGKLGYKRVGHIVVKDENDPEIVYLKRLK